jgi:MFS family permease
MSATSSAASTRARWLRLFLPFAIAYFLAYLLRNANAVIAPVLTRELDLGAADLGLLTSAYFLAFGAFQIPLGMLLDRFGPRRVEALLMLFAAAGTAVFALGGNIATLAIGRALIGLGVSACLMATLKHFSQWYPPERQSGLTGAIMASGGLGAISASVPLDALLPIMGWRGVFGALTGAIVAAAALIFLVVPDHADAPRASTLRGQWRDVAQIFASRDFWRYAPLMTLFSGGFMAITGLWIVPWFIGVDGLARNAAAFNLLFMSVTQLASYFAIALLATPLVRRGLDPSRFVATALAVAWLCLTAAIAGVHPALPFWVAYSFCAATATLMYAALGACFPAPLFGRVSTTLNLLVFAGAFSLQWGLGALVDLFAAAGWSSADAFRAAFSILAALQLLAWLWFWAGRRIATPVRRSQAEPPAL